MIRQIAVGAALLAVIAAVSVEAAQITPPVPPTKAPAPLTLDLLNNEINDLQARAANDEREMAQLDARLTQLETQVGGRNFTGVQIQVRQLQTQFQQLQTNFSKHTHTYQGPKFEALTTVGALLNNPGGYQNYVVLLITPEQMKQSKGNLKETYTTGPAKY